VGQIHPVQVLLDEHVVIENVLAAFEAKVLPLPEAPFTAQWFGGALDFFQHFVEGCHHNREEELVFPQLRDAGLIKEHDSGSEYLAQLQASFEGASRGESEALARFRSTGLAYTRFMRDHINREDELLHWAAGRPVQEDEIQRLQEESSPEKFHVMDEEIYNSYLALADFLCGTLVS
jgi:hemerythrin-like domain-containing protein